MAVQWGVRARGSAAGLSFLLAMAAGCGPSLAPDPTVVPLSSWGTQYAAIRCARIFGCCDATERTVFGYGNEAACRKMTAAQQQKELNQNVGQGLVVYDGKAARRCLDETNATSCAALFNRSNAPAATSSCDDVTRGARKLGATCEDLDFICESSNCLSGAGTCGPPRGCPVPCDVDQYCDEGTHGCIPAKTDGTACSGNMECTPPSVCRMNVCGGPLDDGAACSSNTDCVSAACIVIAAHSTFACGALLPNGATCFGDEDCLSGACLGTAPTQTCAPPMSDGSPCATNAECASGICATRASGVSPTCGPQLCDGI